LRIAERAESKGVRIALLRNQAVLRDIQKAGYRVNTTVYCIDFCSTEFYRLHRCCCRCSCNAACNQQVTFSGSRRSVAFARNARVSLHSTHLTRRV
jgi:hypothetical protein